MAGRIDLLDMIDISEYQYVNTCQAAKAGNFAVLARESAIFSGGITFKLSERAAAETAGRFKAGLDRLMTDGRYRAILKKYRGADRLPDYLFRL
jgi:ABC-type amino acid transport substrate-binding protein